MPDLLPFPTPAQSMSLNILGGATAPAAAHPEKGPTWLSRTPHPDWAKETHATPHLSLPLHPIDLTTFLTASVHTVLLGMVNGFVMPTTCDGQLSNTSIGEYHQGAWHAMQVGRMILPNV